MEPNKHVFLLLKTEKEKTKTIIENVLRMLSHRIFMNNGEKQPIINLERGLKDIVALNNDVYTVTADNGEDYAIKIIFHKLANIGKQSVVSDFMSEFHKHNKIIIARDYNDKIYKYMKVNKSQIFREHTMLSEFLKFVHHPKFELLSPLEMKQVKAEYNIDNYTMKKMLKDDPVARYFDLKKNNIIRIIRPSTLSGYSIDYRRIL